MAKYLVDSNTPVSISAKGNEYITVIINTDKPQINYSFESGDFNVLIYIDYENDIEIKEIGTVKDSSVKMTYFELNSHNVHHMNDIDVLRGSSLDVLTTVLSNNEKRFDFNLINRESDSSVDIANNIVCLKDSDLTFNCIGVIVNGAKRSKCHQKSRCLTIDDPKKAKVLPILKIDENDVEASHSLSCGTIDEDVLFYMNSRGLNKTEALSLIVRSYLMPDESFYEPFECGMEIKEKAERMTSQLC